jgi:type II secretory pathway predicted ATPase ExeA
LEKKECGQDRIFISISVYRVFMAKKFGQLMAAYSKAVEEYCKELDWDYQRFKTAISDEGISNTELYLEDPNEGIVEKLSIFLEPTNQSAVFIIWDNVGMGKSSIRDFVARSLSDIPTYFTLQITDPRLTSFQMLRVISEELDIKDLPMNRMIVKKHLKNRLFELAKKGLITVIWVDEAEKITKDILSELRALSDVKTDDGLKCCKLILSGTPSLIHKIERYIEADPEDAAALDDRASLNTFRLNMWGKEDIYNYWKLISSYCGGVNPFERDCIDVVLEISEGKPRTIAQITKLAIHKKAIQNFFEVNVEGPKITQRDVLEAIEDHLQDLK